MTTLPWKEEGRYVPASVQSTPRKLRSMRVSRFAGSDDQCGNEKMRAAVALAVPAKLGVQVKLPPLTTVAPAQRLSDAARPYYPLRPSRRRAGAGETHMTVQSGTLAAATLSWEASAAAVASYVSATRPAVPGAGNHLEYATGALRITGQNAPGYDERHERLSHLPQFTMLSSPRDRYECNARESEGFASQDEAAAGSRPQSKSHTDASSENRYSHGDDSSEFVETRIREILESEGVRDVAPVFAHKPPPSLPPLQEQAVIDVGDTRRNYTRPSGCKKKGLTKSLGRLVVAAQRAVSVRMVVWRSYNRLAAAAVNEARPGKHARRAGLAPRLPPL